MLYVTTGETFKAELAQDLSSPASKILRLCPRTTSFRTPT